jgi:preprotein translocase subunit SecA
MLGKIAKSVFGSRNDRLIKAYRKIADRITALEPAMQQLDDAALSAKTQEFKNRFQSGETLDQLLPEAFAVVREASVRAMDMRHYDVQLIGAMVLHDGKISEMRTGEGKTLMATLAVYLNALTGKGVHVVTVNDYLAKRDAQWMGKLYAFLGMSTGVIVAGLDHQERQAAYAADITYGTNNEFGFDYLRDNMAFSVEHRVQRGLHYAIVDEVDSILIDEARTPLIISGPTNESSDLYLALDKIAPLLHRQVDETSEGDYYADEKSRQVFISETGHDRVDELLSKAGLLQSGDNLYNPANISLLHHLGAALRAHALYQRNVDYIVRNNEIVIVDEFTGRTMPGRRWSDGLHQAIEAKEKVEVKRENQTLASITFQNYFRMYEKLSGMTGTADTEAYEFQQIYGLEVVVVPTHKPMVRADENDLIYLRQEDKFRAVVRDIKACREKGQPVLVGTASIESSELLAGLLKKEHIPHEVLNAKQHEREAHIIAEAGKPGSVTIATNMAGRGTDIVLGGNLEAELAALGDEASEAERQKVKDDWRQRHAQVIEAGGLHIVGTERHESRRVDNQLRGRAGRQGDPGRSRFFISLEDNLMRIFASDRMRGLMQRFGLEGDEAIENSLVTRSIENAQRKVEAHNFDIRKNLLEYDDVSNEQRKVIYGQRNELMEADDIAETIAEMRDVVIAETVAQYIPHGSLEEQWDVSGLVEKLQTTFAMDLPISQWLEQDDKLNADSLQEKIQQAAAEKYQDKETRYTAELMRRIEKDIMLQILDNHWKDHLAAMDYLRQSVGLRGYAQKNPKQEYKRESFEMFQMLLERIKHDVISFLMRIEIRTEADVPQLPDEEATEKELQFQHPEAGAATSTSSGASEGEQDTEAEQPFRRAEKKVGRNDPCPCGSGKKYKHCHGKLN